MTMTPKNPPIDLPKIPSLPPIQMPDTSNLFHPSSAQKNANSTSSRPSSSSPYASQDTFLTAHTSLSPDQPSSSSGNGSPVYSYPPPPTMTTPTGLRKSISVDSFVSYKHPAMAAARPTPPSPLSSDFRASQGEPDRAPPPSARQSDASTTSFRPPWVDRDKRATAYSGASSRSRGTSVSTNTDDRDPGILDESDLERSEDFSRRVRKSKQFSRQSVRPGELPMPSRLQPKGSAPSMQTPRTAAPVSPSRSSSLNLRNAKQKSLIPVSNHLEESAPEITLLVIGPRGCGKSTVIQKGLKYTGLGKPEEVTVEFQNGKGLFTYAARRGVIPAGQDMGGRTLRVLEADVSAFNLNDAFGIWEDANEAWDGIIICYDVTVENSLLHVEDLLRTFGNTLAPCIVLACKSELEHRIKPSDAVALLGRYDTGLVEASSVTETGKDRIRKAFQWVFKSMTRPQDHGSDGHRNPASPAILTSGSPLPWEISRASSATPTASSPHPIHLSQQPSPTTRTLNHAPSQSTSQATRAYHSPLTSPVSGVASTPASPTRAHSTSDLLSEHEKSKREEREGHAASTGRNSSHTSLHAISGLGADGPSSTTDVSTSEGAREHSMKESRAPPWMSVEDLLNKLLFMAVCDDDPVFISHFLLTYRRFATPRTVLLAMQKRMRALDHPTGDPMFACYAQMRICQLLDHWISLYPTDFTVSGASGALAALIKSILNKTYLLHYGAEFLPFLEMVSSLKDKDSSWSLKVEDESSDTSSVSDEEHSFLMDHPVSQRSSSPPPMPTDHGLTNTPAPQSGFARERKASLPLTAKALIAVPVQAAAAGPEPTSNSPTHLSPKIILRLLQNTSQLLHACDPADIAQEMTRIQCQFFLRIEPRHWLQHVLVQGKKDTEADPITVYNLISNHFGEWVVSLILCHDRPKSRARQIEKFIDVANRLRNLNNYSGLRAIVAGINSATFEGDESLELLRTKSSEHWKNFQQWDQLLQSVRSHQKYRMALRNTKGACIPALEIHLSDLIRAHEGNPDYHDDDPAKIHWAKFNMMARFIDTIVQCQKGCRESGEYDRFQDRVEIRRLFLTHQEDALMDYEMQRSRIALPDLEYEDNYRPRVAARDPNHKDAAIFRKLLNFSWA